MAVQEKYLAIKSIIIYAIIMNILKISKLNYTEIQHFNIEFKENTEWLESFFWHCWSGLLPEKRDEQVEYINYLIGNKIKYIDSEHRHNFGLEIMAKNGWAYGSRHKIYDIGLNGNLIPAKKNPFLLPWAVCPDGYKKWSVKKDRITEKNIKDYI